MRPVFLAFTAVLLLGAASCSDEPASNDDATDSVDTDDAETAETDTGPISKPTTLSFTFNGIADTFKVNATADYTASSRSYALMAQRSERSIQILIEPTELGAKDTWTDQSVANGRVTICFNNGGTAGEFLDCDENTVFTAKSYTLTISENGGPGGYIEGTLSATMIDRFNDVFPIDGQFVLLHR
jgi:hypothetical protein